MQTHHVFQRPPQYQIPFQHAVQAAAYQARASCAAELIPDVDRINDPEASFAIRQAAQGWAHLSLEHAHSARRLFEADPTRNQQPVHPEIPSPSLVASRFQALSTHILDSLVPMARPQPSDKQTQNLYRDLIHQHTAGNALATLAAYINNYPDHVELTHAAARLGRQIRDRTAGHQLQLESPPPDSAGPAYTTLKKLADTGVAAAKQHETALMDALHRCTTFSASQEFQTRPTALNDAHSIRIGPDDFRTFLATPDNDQPDRLTAITYYHLGIRFIHALHEAYPPGFPAARAHEQLDAAATRFAMYPNSHTGATTGPDPVLDALTASDAVSLGLHTLTEHEINRVIELSPPPRTPPIPDLALAVLSAGRPNVAALLARRAQRDPETAASAARNISVFSDDQLRYAIAAMLQIIPGQPAQQIAARLRAAMETTR